jgi:uncharacterized protein (TIGR02145 family)
MKKALPLLLALCINQIAFSQNAYFDVRFFLEGPYQNGQMATTLNSTGNLPLNQPFSGPPWNYEGLESVATIPNSTIVDWVLVDLVKIYWNSDVPVLELLHREACFLKNNGQLTALSGSFYPLFQFLDNPPPFHLRIHHRNHLSILSSDVVPQVVSGVYSWYFSDDVTSAMGGELSQKEVAPGVWVMIAADANTSGQIDNTDKNEVWLPDLSLSGYHPGDFNMDSYVDYTDKFLFWKENAGRSAIVTRDSIFLPPDCPDQVVDVEGNVYATVMIADRCWMKENLRTVHYKNGTPITNVSDGTAWANLTTEAYAWFGNDSTWKDEYGPLYNWWAVADPNGLCPEGWKMPVNSDWIALSDLAGGTSSPNGNKLKSCRQVNSPFGGLCNTSVHPRWDYSSLHHGTDDFGISALPGGYRGWSGDFYDVGKYGGWWSATEDWNSAYSRMLDYSAGYIIANAVNKRFGLSVRCIKE